MISQCEMWVDHSDESDFDFESTDNVYNLDDEYSVLRVAESHEM